MRRERVWKHKDLMLHLGCALFSGMVLLCFLGSLLLPLDAYQSEGELKNLAPSISYMSYPDHIDTKEILDIQSGISYSAALTKKQEILIWGDPSFPSSTKTGRMMAAGYHHLLVMDEEHRIYTYEGSSVKELNVSDPSSIRKLYAGNDLSAGLYEDGRLEIWESEHTSFAIPEKLQGHIKSVDFSNYHAVVVLDDGSIQILGNQGSELAELPEVLKSGTVFVKEAAISNEAGIAIDEEGHIYSWGNIAMDADDLPKAAHVFASAHTLYIHTQGKELIAFGENAYRVMEFDQDAQFDKVFVDTYHMYGIKDDHLQAWGLTGFPFGSDAMGRDMLTRLLHGGRTTMLIGLIVCIVEAALGLLLGMIAGYFGGWIDHIVMRLCEILSSIPFLPLVITISAFMKDQLNESWRILFIMVVLGILSAPSLARMVRSIILVEKEKEYVISAQIMGARTSWIFRHELFPQVVSMLLVHLTLSYADTMLIESSLSFLGFGVAPPNPTWGNMLEGAQSTFVLKNCWWQWLLPALCIFLSVWSVNLIGDGLQRRLQPQKEEVVWSWKSRIFRFGTNRKKKSKTS